MLAKVAGRDTRTVVNALIKRSEEAAKKELYKSLTWDRGKEQTDRIGALRWSTQHRCLFLQDPQSPWQTPRGSNENTQWPRCVLQYFSKAGTDLSVHSQAYLNKVVSRLNERPRETLQFETPAERFNACVCVDRLSRQTQVGHCTMSEKCQERPSPYLRPFHTYWQVCSLTDGCRAEFAEVRLLKAATMPTVGILAECLL